MAKAHRQLLTPDQLAEYLQISVSWIRKRTMTPEARARSGVAEAMPHVKVGGAVRFDLPEIEAWLKAQPRRRVKRNGGER